MAGFTIMADISQHIMKVLKTYLYPNYLQTSEAIRLVSPGDKNMDFQVGIFLYDIESLGNDVASQVELDHSQGKQYPPKALNLKYMIYINSKAQVAFQGEDEQRFLGIIIQALHDNSVIDIKRIHTASDAFDMPTPIEMVNISLDDKSKIWSSMGLAIQPCLYLEVSPILLASKKVEPIQRVIGRDFQVQKAEEV